MLCEICKSLFRDSKVLQEDYYVKGVKGVIPQTLKDLEISALEGCQLCFLRWDGLSADERAWLEECTIEYGPGDYRDEMVFIYSRPADSHDYVLQEFMFVMKDSIREDDAADLIGASLTDTTSSTGCLNLARHWIKRCLETHPSCSRPPAALDKYTLPKRLIDLGSTTELDPSLCESHTLDAYAQYVTLSHCWGQDTKPLRLIKENISSLCLVIDPSQLPSTFLHAMTITKRLGLRYLWIDSLCIAQDDEDEWASESVRMGDIYENSYCTIAAAKGGDSSAGCFTTRNLLCVQACLVNSDERSDGRSFICYNFNRLSRLRHRNPLADRGWVFQETILSPRKLYFTEQQIMWECKEMRACESYPGGMPDRGLELHLDIHRFRGLGRFLAIGRRCPKNVYETWYRFVERYSECTLSFPDKDKLVAISGLAKKLRPEGQYAAGLWVENLYQDLCWRVGNDAFDKQTMTCSRIDRRTPSWSWASVDCPVAFAFFSVTPRPIANLTVQMDDHDSFGPLQRGVIRAKAFLAVVTSGQQDDLQIYHDTEFQLDGSQMVLYPLVACPCCSDHKGIVLSPTGRAAGQYYRRGLFVKRIYLTREKNGIHGEDENHCWLDPIKEHQLRAPSLGKSFRTRLHTGAYEDYLGQDEETGFHRYQISII